MNEREEFLRRFRSVFIQMVDRLDTMTEDQVLKGILEVKAARAIHTAELAARMAALIQAGPQQPAGATWTGRSTREELASLASIHTFYTSVQKLQSRAGAKVPTLGPLPFNALENALHERLDSLRNGPRGEA